MSILRLATFFSRGNALPRIGILTLDNSKVFDIQAFFAKNVDFSNSKKLQNKCNDMISIIENETSTLPLLKSALVSCKESDISFIDINEVSLLAPIPLPSRNIFCVGKNYLDHIAEVKAADSLTKNTDTSDSKASVEIPKYAQFFTKAPDCVIGPKQTVERHEKLTNWLDYEAELAVVIGKQGRDIPVQDALNHVFGYSIGNDVTARDIQRRHVQFFKGKTLDSSCPMGPCIVPRLDLPDDIASNLAIKLWLNDELKQNSRTSNMIFNVANIIHQLSQGFTLKPGDIILTGTPAGVGYASTPPFSLKSGDHIKIEIENIGILENWVK